MRLVQDILTENAKKYHDKVSLIYEGHYFTYGQINEMADRMANGLVKNGIKPGDRLVIYMLNSLEAVVSIFAILKANATFAIVDYAATYDKLHKITADCAAAGIITHHHQHKITSQLLQNVPSVKFVIFSGAVSPSSRPITAGKYLDFDSLQHNFAPQKPVCQRIDRDMAYLIYTSGSTGEVKGVITTHHSSLFAIDIAIEYLKLSASDILTTVLPLSYSHGFNQLLKSFKVGATLLLEKSFAYPTVTLKRMEKEQVTAFAGVPTVYAMLLKLKLERYTLNRIRYFSSAGAPLAPSVIRQLQNSFPQSAIFSIYGMAEASNALGLDPEQVEDRATSVGKAMPGTEVWIQDKNGKRLGANQTGELVVRGGHVRCGYWNNPSASQSRFRPGPVPGETMCHTGDLFRQDKEGYFYFVGRGDEIIKSGGKKIAPKEIENALYDLAGVLETAVIGMPDSILGQAIKAYVVLDKSITPVLTSHDISTHCRNTLAEYMVPRQIKIVESLPKTDSGKIKKSALV
jgi:long-chain acyl-CoA synthetase